MSAESSGRPEVEVGSGVEGEPFFGASYHPFRYFSVRSGQELDPLMARFLELMETADEIKANRELFRLAAPDIELAGRDLWDVVLREALLYSRFMVRSRTQQGRLLLPPRIIFHLHPHLVGRYDSGESAAGVSCEQLKEDFPLVYIHFGKEAGIITPDGRKPIEGAYARSHWDADKESLLMEVLLAPGSGGEETFLQLCSILRRMALDGGYIYFWLGYDKKPCTVGEALDLNMTLNAEGLSAQVLLRNEIQKEQVLGACRVLVPFFRRMSAILTLARQEGLGRREVCDAIDVQGVRVERRVVRGVEVLLVDEN
ncbi:MAG: hypothetical protein GX751_09960 [Desulfuromonadaceae bacterium]|nr:hypothetical protein [Desulfuromonadaceae bacterium]